MPLICGLLNRAFRDDENSIQITENPNVIKSKSNYYTGALSQQALITPPTGKRINVLGITLETGGTNGNIYLKRGNGIPLDPEINTDIVLPLFVSVQNKASASNNLNVVLDVDETLDLEIINISKDSFVGVSYRLV